MGIDRHYTDLMHSPGEASEREVVEGVSSDVVAVRTGERATSWCEDGEREPEIRIGLGDVQREGSGPGDEERVWTVGRHMKISHCTQLSCSYTKGV